ncbi:hypothetical protein ASF27_20130 [Methylobacterium sp. Leaf102]|uniref:hypothetical protein n=1 Tax=Methylobacterium sp. Leaf102 TaxID=1736253 RepID=UPI0006F7ECE1|nr:hypothetical protein [Methylobacterium sp. Leaf102]KQP29472.1 hypothetical protein ASF27_20130 [Methylobacterium sp. Leaf102]
MLRIASVDVRKGADLLGMAVQTMVRVYGQWTMEGQEAAAEALADTRGLRKAVPLLALVPMLSEPVVMATPANDDAATRRKATDRRRVDTPALRVGQNGTPVPPRSPARLSIVA